MTGDVRRPEDLKAALAEPFDAVLHLAGQVAVTTSIVDPVADWEANAARDLPTCSRPSAPGTARIPPRAPLLLYASTNKVYGHLSSGDVLRDGRWDLAERPTGVSEDESLSFESPYGCSKGAADQYVVDYHRSFGLPTVAFRQSCIYGIRQFGEEDQGWVAWFALAASFGLPITIYGDGLQVRDLLWVDDLVDAYLAAVAREGPGRRRAPTTSAAGPAFRLSLQELLDRLGRKLGKPDCRRPGAVAPRRPARLLLRHRARRAGARLEAARLAGPGRRPAARLDRGQPRGDRPFLTRKGIPVTA